MSIVVTEIESIHGAAEEQRLIFYRCQDSQGVWHRYGPVISNDAAFDADAHKAIVAEQVGQALANAEVDEVIS